MGLFSQLDRHPRIRLEVAHPVRSLAATREQVHSPTLSGEPDLDAVRLARPAPDGSQIQIRFAGPPRQPILVVLVSGPLGHGRFSSIDARRLSGPEQRLDGAVLVHGAVAIRY